MVGIGKQREVEVELARELVDRPHLVGRDPDHPRPGLRVVGAAVADPAGLGGAPWGVGAGVKKQYERLILEIRELDGIAILIRQREGGSSVARLKHQRSSLLGGETSCGCFIFLSIGCCARFVYGPARHLTGTRSVFAGLSH
jgi:hypothetical protein